MQSWEEKKYELILVLQKQLDQFVIPKRLQDAFLHSFMQPKEKQKIVSLTNLGSTKQSGLQF